MVKKNIFFILKFEEYFPCLIFTCSERHQELICKFQYLICLLMTSKHIMVRCFVPKKDSCLKFSRIPIFSPFFQNLVQACSSELESGPGYSRRRGAGVRNNRGSGINVSARQREGGSLPSNVNHVQVCFLRPFLSFEMQV